MTGELSKNFHGVGIGPLSKIWAVKINADENMHCTVLHNPKLFRKNRKKKQKKHSKTSICELIITLNELSSFFLISFSHISTIGKLQQLRSFDVFSPYCLGSFVSSLN